MSKIWLLVNETVNGYDTFDSAVVFAENEDEARMVHPGRNNWDGRVTYEWCDAKDVIVEYIGRTERIVPDKVICASFNAG